LSIDHPTTLFPQIMPNPGYRRLFSIWTELHPSSLHGVNPVMSTAIGQTLPERLGRITKCFGNSKSRSQAEVAQSEGGRMAESNNTDLLSCIRRTAIGRRRKPHKRFVCPRFRNVDEEIALARWANTSTRRRSRNFWACSTDSPIDPG
jgi:hypothetical protein